MNNAVDKFEEMTSTILGEIRAAQCGDSSGVAIRPESQNDMQRITEALCPLLQDMINTGYLLGLNPTTLVGQRQFKRVRTDQDGHLIVT